MTHHFEKKIELADEVNKGNWWDLDLNLYQEELEELLDAYIKADPEAGCVNQVSYGLKYN